MVRSRKHDQGYVKPAKAVATRDGILRVAPLKLVTREDDEAKEIVQMFRIYTTKAIILKPAKAIATRDGILSVAPLKSITVFKRKNLFFLLLLPFFIVVCAEGESLEYEPFSNYIRAIDQ
ncbi:uncharacterized protein G2W53_044611 [Senna tora]|uniref:Uncharacterized protein n=1 Tax=Senna tora TaxID=362788 RepID=A0A834SCC1_9FABA|nr:uncharacterized protein G2W53_044611 [Senna tora]